MFNTYELSPAPGLLYVDRQKHWPKDDMVMSRLLVIAETESRAREYAAAQTMSDVWLDNSLTIAQLIPADKEYFIGSM